MPKEPQVDTPEGPAPSEGEVAFLKFGPTSYRVKAADKRASGGGFASPYYADRAEAEAFASWLQSQGDRFSLIRLEASREAMFPAP